MKFLLNPQVKPAPPHFTRNPIKFGPEFYLQRLISCSASVVPGGALARAAQLVGTSSVTGRLWVQSQSAHTPGLQARSLVGVCTGGTQSTDASDSQPSPSLKAVNTHPQVGIKKSPGDSLPTLHAQLGRRDLPGVLRLRAPGVVP